MTNTTKSIINVTVNGMTAGETIENVKSRRETVEKSAFNIALIIAITFKSCMPIAQICRISFA